MKDTSYMPIWKLKNPFPSKKQAFKTLAVGYSLSVVSLFIGFMWLSEYRKFGYYIDRKYGFIFYGDSALVTIIGIISLSSLLLLYTIYWTICVFILIRRKEFKQLIYKPEFVICPKCKKPYYSKDIPDLRCLNCGERVEDISGFYDRHPELK